MQGSIALIMKVLPSPGFPVKNTSLCLSSMSETSGSTPEEMCIVDKITFETLIKEVKHTYGSGFAKMYRDMPEGEFVENVTEEMERWMFLKKEDDMHQIKICPLTGKIQGSYPEDYMGGRNDE